MRQASLPARRLAEEVAVAFREMRGGDEAAGERHVDDRHIGLQQQQPGAVEAQLDIIAGRRAAQVRASVDGSQPSPALTERISALHDAANDLTASMTTNHSAAIPVHGLAHSRVQGVSGSTGPQVTL